jgi:hypothetical protein
VPGIVTVAAVQHSGTTLSQLVSTTGVGYACDEADTTCSDVSTTERVIKIGNTKIVAGRVGCDVNPDDTEVQVEFADPFGGVPSVQVMHEDADAYDDNIISLKGVTATEFYVKLLDYDGHTAELCGTGEYLHYIAIGPS